MWLSCDTLRAPNGCSHFQMQIIRNCFPPQVHRRTILLNFFSKVIHSLSHENWYGFFLVIYLGFFLFFCFLFCLFIFSGTCWCYRFTEHSFPINLFFFFNSRYQTPDHLPIKLSFVTPTIGLFSWDLISHFSQTLYSTNWILITLIYVFFFSLLFYSYDFEIMKCLFNQILETNKRGQAVHT